MLRTAEGELWLSLLHSHIELSTDLARKAEYLCYVKTNQRSSHDIDPWLDAGSTLARWWWSLHEFSGLQCSESLTRPQVLWVMLGRMGPLAGGVELLEVY